MTGVWGATLFCHPNVIFCTTDSDVKSVCSTGSQSRDMVAYSDQVGHQFRAKGDTNPIAVGHLIRFKLPTWAVLVAHLLGI